jgi:TMEM175 potassium channel family protein
VTKGRMEAFSDGVIAIIITVMVLGLRVPARPDLAALRPLVPQLLSYALSFVLLGIYWSNHHHLLQAVQVVDGRVLWANLHLLFWLSLVPVATAWMGPNHREAVPVALYGAILLLASVAYYGLTRALISAHGSGSQLAAAVGRDVKGKVSTAIYAVAIAAAFAAWWLAVGLYVVVACIWFVPDRRIERMLTRP